MNLIEVSALLAISVLALYIFICLRINRRRAIRAERMMRCLNLAIRSEGTLVSSVFI